MRNFPSQIDDMVHTAAEDTTVSIISTFFLAMVLHPEVFQKAQTEMDNVVGTNKLPTFEDRDSLPYLECVFKEVCRWNPAVPLGLPHRLMVDDVYRGYHIPKGTTIMDELIKMDNSWPTSSTFLILGQSCLDQPQLGL
ncbi:hypothetical protein D9757_003240 [Collybiopsis confluens]|uniref:Cytochrome P450 n=1 Tax=Collybiopsis confluens TaxID=2823264 RepID=A0A8H5MFM3_9AGAR|nr:hypothetical protein D9757_003240 [Collybiopsis confluens]